MLILTAMLKLHSLLKFQVFQTRFSNQKVPQSDEGSKNHFGFVGQVNFNKSSMTRMVFFTNFKVVLLTNPKVVLIKKNYWW